jgi:hypothetical protein
MKTIKCYPFQLLSQPCLVFLLFSFFFPSSALPASSSSSFAAAVVLAVSLAGVLRLRVVAGVFGPFFLLAGASGVLAAIVED